MHDHADAGLPHRCHVLVLGDLIYPRRYVAHAGSLYADDFVIAQAPDVDESESILPNLGEGMPVFCDVAGIATLTHEGKTALGVGDFDRAINLLLGVKGKRLTYKSTLG